MSAKPLPRKLNAVATCVVGLGLWIVLAMFGASTAEAECYAGSSTYGECCSGGSCWDSGYCGDGHCSEYGLGEDATNCPSDCKCGDAAGGCWSVGYCGDGHCSRYGLGEDESSCAQDCGPPAATCAHEGAGIARPASTFSAASATSTGIGWNYNMGYRFTALKSGSVTGLGGFYSGTKTVRLYEYPSGTLLGSLEHTSANSFSYGTLPAPIRLTAGQEYVVAVNLAGSGGAYFYQATASYPPDRGIQISCGTYSPNTTAMPTACRTNVVYGMADMTFQADEETPGYGIFDGVLLTTRYAWNYQMGYRFVVNEPVVATALGGVYDGAKTVSLYAYPSGLLLAQTTNTSSGCYTYTDLGTPVTLLPGERYVVAVNVDNSGGIYESPSPVPSTTGSVTIECATYLHNNYSGMPTNCVTGRQYGLADVRLEPVVKQVLISGDGDGTVLVPDGLGGTVECMSPGCSFKAYGNSISVVADGVSWVSASGCALTDGTCQFMATTPVPIEIGFHASGCHPSECGFGQGTEANGDVCYCDEYCVGYGDCCGNMEAVCESTTMQIGCEPAQCTPGATQGTTSFEENGAACSCDPACVLAGDCCTNRAIVCEEQDAMNNGEMPDPTLEGLEEGAGCGSGGMEVITWEESGPHEHIIEVTKTAADGTGGQGTLQVGEAEVQLQYYQYDLSAVEMLPAYVKDQTGGWTNYIQAGTWVDLTPCSHDGWSGNRTNADGRVCFNDPNPFLDEDVVPDGFGGFKCESLVGIPGGQHENAQCYHTRIYRTNVIADQGRFASAQTAGGLHRMYGVGCSDSHIETINLGSPLANERVNNAYESGELVNRLLEDIPEEHLPQLEFPQEQPFTLPAMKTVLGAMDGEIIDIGGHFIRATLQPKDEWRIPAVGSNPGDPALTNEEKVGLGLDLTTMVAAKALGAMHSANAGDAQEAWLGNFREFKGVGFDPMMFTTNNFTSYYSFALVSARLGIEGTLNNSSIGNRPGNYHRAMEYSWNGEELHVIDEAELKLTGFGAGAWVGFVNRQPDPTNAEVGIDAAFGIDLSYANGGDDGRRWAVNMTWMVAMPIVSFTPNADGIDFNYLLDPSATRLVGNLGAHYRGENNGLLGTQVTWSEDLTGPTKGLQRAMATLSATRMWDDRDTLSLHALVTGGAVGMAGCMDTSVEAAVGFQVSSLRWFDDWVDESAFSGVCKVAENQGRTDWGIYLSLMSVGGGWYTDQQLLRMNPNDDNVPWAVRSAIWDAQDRFWDENN